MKQDKLSYALGYLWRGFKALKPRYFLIIFVLFGLVFVYSLRHNYMGMMQLRQQVYQADKQDGDVKAALQNLRHYVYNHMNTSLASGPNAVYPPIQLKYTYDRLVQARSAKLVKNNAQIYTEAQHFCEAKIPSGFSGRYRISCIQSYVKSHGVKQKPVADSLYKFDFVSAKWSPDLAGWSLVATAISGLVFVVSLATSKFTKPKARDS